MFIRRMSMEKLLFGDLEDCLNPVEELLDGLQSSIAVLLLFKLREE
jgi:hypothetical protein